MDTAYHPDFGVRVAYMFERMPDDPDAQVRQSMAKAISLIRKDATVDYIDQIGADGEVIAKIPSPLREYARKAAEGGDPISGTWKMIKPFIKFRQDVDIAADLDHDQKDKWKDEDLVEVFIRPVDQSLLIALRGVGVEDCDGFTMYGACLLTALGIPCALVTVAADSKRPREFSHVYVAAYYKGQRIPLDFSHGPYPGWECPSTRKAEWPVWETPVERAANGLLPIAMAGAIYAGMRWFNRRAA